MTPMVRDQVRGVTPALLDVDGTQLIAGQAWEWAEDRRTMKIYFLMLKQEETQWKTNVLCTTYRALQREEMSRALAETGFTDIEWRQPSDTGYVQPIVTARAVN